MSFCPSFFKCSSIWATCARLHGWFWLGTCISTFSTAPEHSMVVTMRGDDLHAVIIAQYHSGCQSRPIALPWFLSCAIRKRFKPTAGEFPKTRSQRVGGLPPLGFPFHLSGCFLPRPEKKQKNKKTPVCRSTRASVSFGTYLCANCSEDGRGVYLWVPGAFQRSEEPPEFEGKWIPPFPKV